MEHISVHLGSDDMFDECVHSGLPEGGDISLVTKDHATEGGRAAVVITWTTQLPDGQVKRVQAVATVKCFLMAAAALRGRYGDDGILQTFDKVN